MLYKYMANNDFIPRILVVRNTRVIATKFQCMILNMLCLKFP